MGGLLIAPLGAAESRRQDGVIAGSAAAEAKQPYSNYIIRGRDVTTNNIAQTTTLDANGDFALNSMMAGTYMVELVKGAAPTGQGGKVVCTAGPFTLQDSTTQVNDLMIKKGANVHCNRPMAGYYLLGAATAAGVTAGLAAATRTSQAYRAPGGLTSNPVRSAAPSKKRNQREHAGRRKAGVTGAKNSQHSAERSPVWLARPGKTHQFFTPKHT